MHKLLILVGLCLLGAAPAQTGSSGCFLGAGNHSPALNQEPLATGNLSKLCGDISKAPLDPNSKALVALLGSGKLGVDFCASSAGRGLYNCIPYNVVPATQPMVPVTTTAKNPDFAAAPIPTSPSIEGYLQSVGIPTVATATNHDHHLLTYQLDAAGNLSTLWELYKPTLNPDGSVSCTGLAKWDLTTGDLRRPGVNGTTSGSLPVAPLLATLPDVQAGVINRPIRCVVPYAASLRAAVWPARTSAGASGYLYTTTVPKFPMGARLRLSSSYDTSAFTGQAATLATRLKTAGVIVDDQSNNFAIEGTQDDGWNQTELAMLATIPCSAFEVLQIFPQYTVTPKDSLGREEHTFKAGDVVNIVIARQTQYAGGSYVDTNFGANVYCYDYLGGYVPGGAHTNIGAVALSPATPSKTLTFHPKTAGKHYIVIADGSTEDLPPPPVVLNVQ